MPNTIVLKGDLSKRAEEYPANDGTIKPGHFIELISTGKCQKNATAGADAPVIIAKEDSLQGNPITVAYAADNPVFAHHAQKGDMLNARVAAGHAAIAYAAALKLQNDGTVMAHGGTGTAKFRAEEAVDNSAGSAEAFIKVRVI